MYRLLATGLVICLFLLIGPSHAGVDQPPMVYNGNEENQPISPVVSQTANDTARGSPTSSTPITERCGSHILVGMPGSSGPAGPQGMPGVQGPTGFPGAPGNNGVNGYPGPAGLTGVKGDVGEPGLTGAQVGWCGRHAFKTTSNIIRQVVPCSYRPNFIGAGWMKGTNSRVECLSREGCTANHDRGVDGEPGFPGSPGVEGEAGRPGGIGISGAPGKHGLPGLKGEAGLSGLRGLRGETGVNGERGNDGRPGSPGECNCRYPEPTPNSRSRAKIAFSAARTSGLQATNGPAIVGYQKVFSNQGNSLNKDTGIFRCSVAGTYFFTMNIYKSSAQNFPLVQLLHNGDHTIAVIDYGVTDTEDTATNSVVLDLGAGDEVYLQLYDGRELHSSHYRFTTFSGFLLFEA